MSTRISVTHALLAAYQFPTELVVLITAYFANELCLAVEVLDAFRSGSVEKLIMLQTYVQLIHVPVDPHVRKAKVNAIAEKEIKESIGLYLDAKYFRTSADSQVSYGYFHCHLRTASVSFKAVAETTALALPPGPHFCIQDEVVAHTLAAAPWQQIPKILQWLIQQGLDFKDQMERYRVKWENDSLYQRLTGLKPEIIPLTPIVYENKEDPYFFSAEREGDQYSGTNFLQHRTEWYHPNPNKFIAGWRQAMAIAPEQYTQLDGTLEWRPLRINDLGYVGILHAMTHSGFELFHEASVSMLQERGYGLCLYPHPGAKPCPNPRLKDACFCYSSIYDSKGQPPCIGRMSVFEYRPKPKPSKKHPIYHKVSLTPHAIPGHNVLTVDKYRFLMKADRTFVGREDEPFVPMTHDDVLSTIHKEIAKIYRQPNVEQFDLLTVVTVLLG
jgi:hypothetical protein